MTDYPKYDKEDAVLATLCYCPVLLNFLMPLYILLANKGGKYAKFHAMQGFALFIITFLVMNGLYALLIPHQLDTIKNIGNMQTFQQNFQTTWNETMAAMLPLQLIQLAYLVIMIYLMYIVYQGKELRIPIIAEFFLNKV